MEIKRFYPIIAGLIVIALVFYIKNGFTISIGPYLFVGLEMHKTFPADIKIIDASFSENGSIDVTYTLGTLYRFGEYKTLSDVEAIVFIYSGQGCDYQLGGARSRIFNITYPNIILAKVRLSPDEASEEMSVKIKADSSSEGFLGDSDCVPVK